LSLSGRLQAGEVLHMRAGVSHGRRGAIRHGFRYGVDYLLFAPESMRPPALMSRDGFNLFSYRETDHGGPRGRGSGASWVWERLAEAGLSRRKGLVLGLLAQPRVLWSWFNPVSFWMAVEGDKLIAVIAEVNNTFDQRHCHLLRNKGFAPIGPESHLHSEKVFHVSPFQDVRGDYQFGFRLAPDRIAIRIRHMNSEDGLDAAMSGGLVPLTSLGVIGASLRRPGGPLRVLALIHWHALQLKLKGAAYRRLPAPPEREISR